MSSRKFFGKASLFVFLLGTVTVTKTGSDCLLPVYETAMISLIANTTYSLKCPPKYFVARIIGAEVRTVPSAGSKTLLNVTVTSCQDKTSSSCDFDVPSKWLVNSTASGYTDVELVVNYTCQAKTNFSGGSIEPTWTTNTTSTNSVTYILTKMMSYGLDWSCMITSSTKEAAVTWRGNVSSCFNQALECSTGNVSDISTLNLSSTSNICMEAQSVMMIRFFSDVYCGFNLATILLDIQVHSGSDLEVQCGPVPPVNLNVNTLDLMRANCSALRWNAPSSKTISIPPPTSRQSEIISSTDTRSIPATSIPDPASGQAEGRETNTSSVHFGNNIDVQGLALGLGLGFGLLVVLIALIIAVVCLRSSRRAKRELSIEKKSAKGEEEGDVDDAGFVSANDLFTCTNVYGLSPPSPTPAPLHTPEATDNANNQHMDDLAEPGNNTQSSTSAMFPPPPHPLLPPLPPPLRPPSSEAAQGKTKKCRTLTKKVFTQIAEAAKQEELKGKAKRKSALAKAKSRESEPETVAPESSYVDVWLYSSTLDGINFAENTVGRSDANGIHIPRRFEIDL